jgi:CRISPR-associated protein (TIGR03984 family)
MAQIESKVLVSKLFISRTKDKEIKELADALNGFVEAFGNNLPKTYALLYAPRRCFLALLKGGKLHNSEGQINPEKEAVYEARVFNETAELRWLNQEDGKGAAVVLCDNDSAEFFGAKPKAFNTVVNEEKKELVDAINQTYLLWGQSTGASNGDGWTQFAEARIGAFHVPVSDIKEPGAHAQFTAIEYLGEYEDGNVAVADERLTGIEEA